MTLGMQPILGIALSQSFVLTMEAKDLRNREKSGVGGSPAASTEYQTAWKISIPIDRSIPTDSSHCNLET